MIERFKHNRLSNINNTVRFYTNKLTTPALALFAALSVSSIATAAPQTAQNINVVSSIKPIQLITTAVIGDLGESKILLPPSANPHNYQLRPSQRTLLNDADLFVWVGPELELFLVKVLKTSSVKQISLTQELQLNKGQQDTPKIEHHDHDHEAHDHEAHEHEAHDHEAHDHETHDHDEHHHDAHDHKGSFDPHIWLNPALTEKIARAIYQQLSNQYPDLEPQLSENFNQFITGLHSTENEITQMFKTKNQVAIYTFHEAFTHFADHYGLKIAGTITKTPEARPGAKHLSELADEIRQSNTICLVKEPNFKAPYINSITRGTEVTVTTADPLATSIDNSETGYFKFLRSIADSFYKCLN